MKSGGDLQLKLLFQGSFYLTLMRDPQYSYRVADSKWDFAALSLYK